MLGKGLESLIPPQRPHGNNGQNSQSGNQPGEQSQPTEPAAQPVAQPTTQPEPPYESAHKLPQEIIYQPEPHVEQEVEPEPHVESQPQSEPQQESEPEQVLYPAPPREEPREILAPPSAEVAAKAFEKPAERPNDRAQNDRAQKRQEDTGPQSIFHIEVEKIRPNPNQPRRDFNEAAIRDLAASIREFGFIQPLVVTKVEKETPTGIDVEYQLIAGERRLHAAKLLGLRVAPAIIRNVALEREKLELAVIENIQRENLNPIEIARSFQRLQEEFHLTQREIASKLGKSREVVANSVRLLDLPAYIQESLQKGELSESNGRLLLSIDDPSAQKKLFDDILAYRLTTRDVKERVKRLEGPGIGGGRGDADEDNLPAEVKAMRESLSMSLGAPVEIKKGANTGKISITFYSEEELENILRRLGEREM